MSLEKYLEKGSIELPKGKVESSTGIELKTLPRWLIYDNRIKKH